MKPTTPLTKQIVNRLNDILNGGVGISFGGGRRFMSCKYLRYLQISSLAIDICYRCVASGMEVVGSLDSGFSLPFLEHGPHRPGGDLILLFTHEHGRIAVKTLSSSLFPTDEFSEFDFQSLIDGHNLSCRFRAGPLEGFQGDLGSDMTGGIQDVSHGKGGDFVFPKSGTERHGNDHVVSKTGRVFTSHFENRFLLFVAQHPRGGENGVDVCCHDIASFDFFYLATICICTIFRRRSIPSMRQGESAE
jgi:hypothetical protein